MAGKIETAFLSSEGNTTPSVPEITPPMGAASLHKSADSRRITPQGDVGESRRDRAMSDADREQAICRASELARYFEAEYRLFWALWTRDSLFDQKAAYDIAMSNYLRATQIRDSLKRGAKQ